MFRMIAAAISLLVAAVASGAVSAQPYPSKPIRIIVPFPPGGPSDVIARAIGETVGPRLGQRIIIDNRPGANQIIAASAALAAPPDGYTFLWATLSLTSLNPYLLRKLPYDPHKSFIPVSLLYKTNEFLIVNGNLKVNTLQDFIALAKERSGAINVASFGQGTLGHLQGVALEKAAGITLNHVPYKGMTNILPDLMTDRVQAVFTSIWSVMSQIQDGTFKVLALSQEKRSPNMPNVPTFKESGIDLAAGAWLGLFAPEGTPDAIVQTISAEFASVAKDRAFRAQYTDKQDLPAVGSTPAEFAAFIKADQAFWAPIIKASGVVLD
jgi:tripartite-type tricarboxylate transporter receptor subunit TctC